MTCLMLIPADVTKSMKYIYISDKGLKNTFFMPVSVDLLQLI
jgi:hypothetical protein